MYRLSLRLLLLLVITLAMAVGAVGSACAQETPQRSAAKLATATEAGATKAATHGAKGHKKRKPASMSARGGVHGRAWAFGGGEQSREAWRGGASTGDLQKRAVGAEASKSKTVNTASGIDSALNATEGKTPQSGLGLSVGQDESQWRRKSSAEIEAPDENLPMQSRHVVRAYADVDAGDDLNISLGPELILKDEQRERAAANKQPESALGMGMRFKLDF